MESATPRQLETTDLAPVGRGMRWASWVASALPAFMMIMSSVMKLTRQPAVLESWAHFGYPPETLAVIGVVELACAVLYLVPRTAVLGAILVTGYLGGAIATHVRVSEPAFVGALLFGVLAWAGLFMRDRRLRALLPLRSPG